MSFELLVSFPLLVSPSAMTMPRILQVITTIVSPWLRSSTDTKTEILRYAILPSLSTSLICLAICAWEFYYEIAHPTHCTSRSSLRTWLVILPQFLLVVAFILQCGRLHRNTRGRAMMVTTILSILVPLAFLAAIHSAFRAGLSLCCCSSLFCPLSRSTQKEAPSTAACSLLFPNCNWALVRKVAHFAATMALLSPLIALRTSNYLINAREEEAKRHLKKIIGHFK